MSNYLRKAAEMRIAETVSLGIQQATPDIQNAAVINSINVNHAATLTALTEEREKIKSHITHRTGFLSGFLVNITAWAAALIITVSILLYSTKPSIEDTMKKNIEGLFKNNNSQNKSLSRPKPGE